MSDEPEDPMPKCLPYLQWETGAEHEKLLDGVRTEARQKALAAKRAVREQLMAGQSEDFRRAFMQREREKDPSIKDDAKDEDPRVWHTRAEVLADQLSTALTKRQRATVVFYGVERAGMTDAADAAIDGVLATLRATVDAAAKQHQIRLQRDEREQERLAAALANPSQWEREEEEKEARRRESLRSVGAAREARKKSGVQTPREREPRGSRASNAPARRQSEAGGKRVSLVKRQSLAAAADPVPRRAAEPGARGVTLVDGEEEAGPERGDAARKLPPLGDGDADGSPASDPASRRLAPRASDGPPLSPASSRPGSAAGTDGGVGASKRASQHGLTSVARNGRKGLMTLCHFDGRTSYGVPQKIPAFDTWSRFWEAEFWVKSEQRMKPMTLLWVQDRSTSIATIRIALNTNERMEYHESKTLFFIRDNSSSSLVGTIHEDVCDGQWHHISFVVRDAIENLLAVRVDGKSCRVSTMCSEGPQNFANWDQSIVLGGELGGTGEGKLENHFLGALADMKIWSHDFQTLDSTLRVHWPLDFHAAHPTTIPDVLGTAGGDKGTLYNPDWRPDDFPETCLYFNGVNSHINLGMLGDFGEQMGSFRVELWMRSSAQEGKMALLKVTDNAHKHAQFGIELNRNVRHEYQKGVTLFIVRDAFGSELTAQQSSHNLCDGEWHHLVWQVSTEKNWMQLKVDCFDVELDYLKKESPSNFFPLNAWVCVGAHNCRGSVQSHYQGFIKDVKIFAGRKQQFCVGEWPLDEGAGASLAMDTTGNGHNGIVYDRQTRRKCATWLRVAMPDAFCAKELDAEGKPQAPVDVSYANNKVELGFFTIHCQSGAEGKHREVLVDLFSDEEVELEPRPCCAYGRAWEAPWLEMRVLPTGRDGASRGALREVGSHTELLALKEEAAATCRDKGNRCSRVFVLRIGDGQLSVYDIAPFNRQTRTQWDPDKCEWVAPIAMMSQDDKATMLLNRKASAVEQSLISVGVSPTLFRRARSKFAACGFADSLAGELLQAALFDTTGGSLLWWVHMQRLGASDDERTCSRWVAAALARTTQAQAAVVVQKMMRRHAARRRMEAAAEAKRRAARRRARRDELRRDHPDLCCARERRVALLISTAWLADPRLCGTYAPALRRARPLAEYLAAQGWEVWRLTDDTAADTAFAAKSPPRGDSPKRGSIRSPQRSGSLRSPGGGRRMTGRVQSPAHPPLPAAERPTRANIAARVAELRELARGGAAVLVHVMGYGAHGAYFRWPTRAELRGRMDAEEAGHRGLRERQEAAEWTSITSSVAQEVEEAEAAAKVREEEEEKEREKERVKEKRKSVGKPSGWVASTAVESKRAQSPADGRKRSAGGSRARKRSSTSLAWIEREFVASPTPALAALPDEPAHSDAPVRYLVPVDAPLEYSAHNTVSLDALARDLLAPELGNHAVLSAEIYPAPYSDGGAGFAFLGASTGEQRHWTGPGAPAFLSYYLHKAVSGSGVHSITGLLKPADQAAAEEGMMERWRESKAAAEAEGRLIPPCPVPSRGVAWDGLWEYVCANMTKRGAVMAAAGAAAEPEYVGDMVFADRRIADLSNIPQRRRNKEKLSGLELRLLLRESRDPAAADLPAAVLERVQALDASFERRDEVAPRRFTLLYRGDLQDALPPSVPEAQWRAHLATMLNAPADCFAYRLVATGSRGRDFCCVVSPADGGGGEGVAAFDAAVRGAVTSTVGAFNVDFAPRGALEPGAQLPAPGPFVLQRLTRELIINVAATRGAVLKVEKRHLAGGFAPLLADIEGVEVAELREFAPHEFDEVETAHHERCELKRKEIERRKNELVSGGAQERQLREMEQKRRSLANQIREQEAKAVGQSA